VVSAAVGTGYRDEDFSDKFDPVTESGDVLGIGGISSSGNRESYSAFAELSLPLLRRTEFQLAGRYDHYSDFGGTFNPKVGVRWQPLGNLLLRGSAGTGFKAPTLQELYSAEIFSFETVLDPTTSALVEVPSLASGNPDLDAEQSDNYTLGLIWDITPAWDMSVDWWRIKNEDAVTSNPQFYVDNEASFPGNVIRDPGGDIVVIFSPFQNVAAQKLWGLDFNTNYDLDTFRAGDFRFTLSATYLGAFEEEPVPGAGFDDLAGEDGRPRVRGKGIVGWSLADYAASVTVNYTGSYDRPAVNDGIGSWTTVDSQFNWLPRSLPGGTLTLGIQNLFDKEPPEDPFLEGWPFFNRALHDPRGRFLYLRYRHQFDG
jgi:outer membrane receptor protein involved in Fe transport